MSYWIALYLFVGTVLAFVSFFVGKTSPRARVDVVNTATGANIPQGGIVSALLHTAGFLAVIATWPVCLALAIKWTRRKG